MADTQGTTPAPRSGTEDAANYIAAMYEEQLPRWQLCRDMELGTEALRANPDYLIQGPAETDDEFDARVQRTELFPMFGETVKGLTGLVFRKDPMLGDDVSPMVKALWENFDNAGTHGAVFMRDAFEDAMTTGHCGILVDATQSPYEDDRPLSIAEANALGVRPYAVHYKAEQIINWRIGRVNGVTVLTLLVLRERSTQEIGVFGSGIVERYRVFRRDLESGVVSWETYTLSGQAGKGPELEDTGILRNAIAIPFSVIYAGKRRAPLVTFPPLVELAYTNVAHAQVSSDRRTSLHYASSPILVFIGRDDTPPDPNRPAVDATQLDVTDPNTAALVDEINGRGGSTPVGPNIGIDLPIGGDAKYIEHGGKALDASDKELTNLEKRGAAQGLSILHPDNRSAETAEAKHLDASQRDASLSRAARSAQDAGEQTLAFFSMFLGERGGGSMTVNRDFEDQILDTALFTQLSKSCLAGQISLPTFWAILVNGQILPDDFDPTIELALLNEQAAGMGAGASRALASGSDTAAAGAPSAGGSGDVLPTQGGPTALQGLPSSVDRTGDDDTQIGGADPTLTGGSIGGASDLSGDPGLGRSSGGANDRGSA